MNIKLEKIKDLKKEIPTYSKYEQEIFKMEKSFEDAWFKYLDSDRGLELYYLKNNKEVIGLLGFTFEVGTEDSVIFEEGKVFSFLMAIAVKEEYKGKGVSKILMDKYLEVSKSKKVDYVALRVEPRNGRAIAFYNKFDFKEYFKNDVSIYMRRNS